MQVRHFDGPGSSAMMTRAGQSDSIHSRRGPAVIVDLQWTNEIHPSKIAILVGVDPKTGAEQLHELTRVWSTTSCVIGTATAARLAIISNREVPRVHDRVPH